MFDRDEATYNADFLDNCSEDLPSGQWRLQFNTLDRLVTVRNLLWPGYSAYHRANTAIFGGSYFGNGIKNLDLPFML